MEHVQAFSDELNSIYDVRPPISKAKMVQITKAAMKGVKMYKHIVQCVEKFIGKCRPEYKIPGLYVIDSIVRQSRHQFGPDRDVFGPRFSLNLQQTFINLFHGCPHDEKPKIVRVLNLWKRNGVFSPQVIEPLLDMGNPISGSSLLLTDSPQSNNTAPAANSNNHLTHQPDNLMLIQQLANTIALVKGTSSHNNIDTNNDNNNQRFNSRKVLDFDYDDDDDNNDGDETPTEAEPPLSTTLSMIQMEERNKYNRSGQHNQRLSPQQYHQTSDVDSSAPISAIMDRWQRLQSQHLISSDLDKQNNRIRSDCDNIKSKHQSSELDRHSKRRERSSTPDLSPSKRAHFDHTTTAQNNNNTNNNNSNNNNISNNNNNQEKQSSQNVVKEELTPEEKEAIRREHEEERKKKGLPEIKSGHLTICSTTLWLGHVPKTVSEADISDAFGEFGTITSIDLIPPRGCAYVCMDRRQDAFRALQELKNLKLSGSYIKMAWAPGKGLKDKEFKDYWEVDIGSSYIPYKKINIATLDIELLEKGGVIDEDTLTDKLRELRDAKAKEREEEARRASEQLSSTIPVPIEALASQLPLGAANAGHLIVGPPPPPLPLPPYPIPPPGVIPMSLPPPPLFTAVPPPQTAPPLPPPPTFSMPPPNHPQHQMLLLPPPPLPVGGSTPDDQLPPPLFSQPPPSTIAGPMPTSTGLGPPPHLYYPNHHDQVPPSALMVHQQDHQFVERLESDIDMRSSLPSTISDY